MKKNNFGKDNVRPNTDYGQHFLLDDQIIDNMVSAIQPQPDEFILEIGAGLGALTLPVLKRSQKLTAVEFDARVIEPLKQKALPIGDLNLIHGDFLKFDLSALGQEWRLIGNLPYQLSSEIMIHCVENRRWISDMHFMLQKEVVERLSAEVGTKDYGRLSLLVQRYFTAEALFDVPPEAFNPPPKVNSAVIRLVKRSEPLWHIQDEQVFALITKTAFGQRRKMLRQSLKSFFTAEQMTEVGIDPTLRPEQLSGAEFALLSNYYAEQ